MAIDHPDLVTRPTPEPVDEILQKVSEGFQLLADLHAAIQRSGGDHGDVMNRITAATAELTAIQRHFNRRESR